MSPQSMSAKTSCASRASWVPNSPQTLSQKLSGCFATRGTCVLVGLPPGEFPIPIFDVVLSGYTIRGSTVGTRRDLHEALACAAEGKVKAVIEELPLEAINDVQSVKTSEGKRSRGFEPE